jgi:hypothetical protein
MNARIGLPRSAPYSQVLGLKVWHGVCIITAKSQSGSAYAWNDHAADHKIYKRAWCGFRSNEGQEVRSLQSITLPQILEVCEAEGWHARFAIRPEKASSASLFWYIGFLGTSFGVLVVLSKNMACPCHPTGTHTQPMNQVHKATLVGQCTDVNPAR